MINQWFINKEKFNKIIDYIGDNQYGEYLKKINCQITPVNSENYKTIAKRPKYSVTDKSRIKDIFNVSIRNWEDALKEFIFNHKWKIF